MRTVDEEHIKRKQIQANLLWYVRIRWTIIGLLGTIGIASTIIFIGWDSIAVRSVELALIIVGLNLGLWYLSQRISVSTVYYRLVAGLQLGVDILFVSYLLYAEGNIRDFAIILYAIPIFASGFLFGRLATIITAGTIALTFSTLQLWQEFGFRPVELGASIQPTPAAYGFLVPITFFTTAFFILAIMAEHISSFTRKNVTNKLEDEIISLATHQLRVPATAVKGYLSLVHQQTEGVLDEKQMNFLEQAIEENNREILLINNLLKTALLDKDKLGLTFEPVSMKAVLKRVTAEHRYRADYKKIKFSYAGKDFTLDAHIPSLHIIFGNLIDNALKYSPVKSNITITYHAGDEMGMVCIHDEGEGMTKQQLKQLFQRFQDRSNTDSRVEGAGLGLYIAKMLAEKHGGNVTAESKRNKGSTFCVSLPRTQTNKGGKFESLINRRLP